VRATVVIPAHDEAAHVERTLAALVAQRVPSGALLDPRTFDVLVYANNCSDATADVVRAFAARHRAYAIHVVEEWLPPGAAHVGTARRAAMNAAAARLSHAPDAVLAGTDADTVVAPLWLASTLEEMRRADVVTGRILIDRAEWDALPVHTRRMLSEENAYHFALTQLACRLDPQPHDPWPRHWQRSGPSFAVRVAAYRDAGGVPAVPVFEDIALYDALERRGARIRHSLRVRVVTSARFGSRAAGGFGTRIAAWSVLTEPASPLLVEHPDVTIARLCRVPAAAPAHPFVPATLATEVLRQMLARASSIERATRASVASIAG
jgi:cellulose synthase/poly-beta-1,6-N-acetylglucosamine synthase-like glycosyltransferase